MKETITITHTGDGWEVRLPNSDKPHLFDSPLNVIKCVAGALAYHEMNKANTPRAGLGDIVS